MNGARQNPDTADHKPKAARESLGFAGWAGIVLSPLVCVWVFRSEILHNSADLASIAPSFAAIGVLLGLLCIRLFQRKLSKRSVLLIYSAIAATVGISTMGMVQFLITTLGAPFWFATPENRWSEFFSSVPDWVALDVYYQHGAATVITDQWRTYQGRIGFADLRSRLDGLVPPTDLPRMLGAAWGFIFLVGLYAGNLRIPWWPFHPAGFVVAQTGALDWFWCPMLIAGVAKVILLRSGGLKLYRRALPFFIGLMVGDYAISIVLTILGWALHTPMYKPFPI